MKIEYTEKTVYRFECPVCGQRLQNNNNPKTDDDLACPSCGYYFKQNEFYKSNMTKGRLGYFWTTEDLITSESFIFPDILKHLEFNILNLHFETKTNKILYKGTSPFFEELEMNQNIPVYDVFIHTVYRNEKTEIDKVKAVKTDKTYTDEQFCSGNFY